jgi:hypothetical protein
VRDAEAVVAQDRDVAARVMLDAMSAGLTPNVESL